MRQSVKGSCSVCAHEERKEIDEAIADAEPYASISDRFAVAKTTLWEHKSRGHVPAEVLAAGGAALVADGLLSKVRKLEEDAHRIRRRAEKQGDFKAAIAAISQLVRLVETAARITGALQTQGGINVELNLDEATAIRVASVFLQRRGLLPAPAIEAEKVEETAAEAPGGPNA